MKHKSWIIAIATIAVAVIIVIVTTLSLTLGRSDKAAEAQAQAQATPTPSPTIGIECEDGETKVTLEAGDSLLSLATEHGMSLSDLLTINPRITNPDTVQIGQTICVSDSSSAAQDQVDCDEFVTIGSGDTFGSIATANGISTSEFMELNPLISDPNLLQLGQKICVSGTNNSISSSSSSTSIVSTASSCDETIFVEEGDTFNSLATENGLTTDELLELNPSIDDPSLIRLGQRICVSANNSTTAASSNTTATTTGVQCDETIMVEEGDTVKTLAAEYNLTISEILALNPEIYDPTLIRLGDSICVAGTPDEASLVEPSINAASVYYSCNQPGLFALTYDDGPARTNINELLAKLAEYNVLATFYVNANNAADLINNQDDQANLQALYDQGHEVGTHTYAHDDLKLLTDTEIVDDLNKNEDVIETIIGRRTALLRPPYLSVNQRVLNVVGELGYDVVSTNLDTRDFENDGLPNDLEMILNIVRTNIEASNPATDSFISLQHEKTGDVVEVTEQIILLAMAKGYKFVTVEECIGLPAYQA